MTGMGNETEAETKTAVVHFEEWLKVAAEAKDAGIRVSKYDSTADMRST